ncbi:MAG: glycosyltransferase [Pseudomonadota bacterium]
MGPDSVSVIIPVKNGLPYFREVCAALAAQDYDAEWDVICIDSGSTDGSQDIARSHGFRVLEIAPETFGHGRTRNLGAETSAAEYVAFLTHDAVPDNNDWLSSLVRPLRDDPKVAGVFSRHIAHHDADPFIAWELDRHFEGLAPFGTVEITDRAAYDADVGLQKVYHFYSDNASALRKSVWQDIPYPDVQFAEDQIWAKTVVEAGWRKAYAPDSVVRHSHAFGPWETMQRGFDEARAFNRLFGYVQTRSIGEVLLTAGYLLGRDMKLALKQGWWKSHPGTTLSRGMSALTRPLGQYLGARRNLAGWLEKRLSRDDWIRRLGHEEDDSEMDLGILHKVARYRKAHGNRATARAIVRTVATGSYLGQPAAEKPAPTSAGGAPQPAGLTQKIDVIGFYKNFLAQEHGDVAELERANPARNTLQWVVPNFGFGSGGHLNIFRFINNLADLGYDQRLVILPPYEWKSAEKAKEKIDKWYAPLKAEVALGADGFEPCHATIATGWQTAYWVAKYQATRDRFYFIQDFEPAFYATSSEYYMAENTYKLGLKGITAGTWLSEMLHDKYGMTTAAVSFGCDTDFYKPGVRRDGDNFNILFYSRHVTKRRLFELGICALDTVCQEHPDVAVIFAGGDVSPFRIPFHHLNAGELTLKELPDLYAQSDLALVLSGTNLSLLPLELAACKCPIVMNDTPSARWLLPDDAAYYAPLDPEGMARVIGDAIRNKKERLAKAEVAYAMAQDSSWAAEAKRVAHYLETL